MIGRILSLLTVPMAAMTIWGLIRQVRKPQRIKLSTPAVSLVMAPITLLINVVILRQAFSAYLGPALLIFGLGFGLAWGQTAKLNIKGRVMVSQRSVLHLVFWGLSCAITQLLATFAPALWVVGGLATMFFSAGCSLGTNLNLLVRQLRLLPALAAEGALHERAENKVPRSLPERGVNVHSWRTPKQRL